jgi:uncharacterized Zn-binding protein involved in type VI secretion
MSAVARLGDPSSHGGTIISASSDVKANGIGVARQGDMHNCPIRGHGVTPLTAIAQTKTNGRQTITVGATAGCGATIVSGSPNVNAN